MVVDDDILLIVMIDDELTFIFVHLLLIIRLYLYLLVLPLQIVHVRTFFWGAIRARAQCARAPSEQG